MTRVQFGFNSRRYRLIQSCLASYSRRSRRGIEQLTDNWRKQTEALARSEKENRLLRELLRLMRAEKFGPASERLSDQQLELLEQEPGVREPEVKAESERAQLQLPLKGWVPP